jgi:type I restriction-modification system DNA methylase subunit
LKKNKGFGEQNSVLKKIFEHPSIKELKPHHWHKILNKLMLDLIPYVNHGTCVGQDILNVFYTVFNKYVGKKDRNQAFTPNHLVHFLCKVAEVNRNSYVLDPTCGSGSFLIRAMVDGVEDAKGDETMINSFKKSHIYGIEADEKAWGYTISNMLLHDNVEGCDNIIKSNCFKVSDETIKGWGIDTVIMNPPFNAQRVYCWDEYATERGWKDDAEDPTKGFHFALWAAQKVGKGKLVVILPTACAIADKTNHELHEVKKLMLEEHTLDAVFSLPSDIFLPGASVNVCCMVFTLGKRHNPNKPSFFGYFKEDGFGMKKHLGRVEKKIGTWDEIEKKWLELYFSKKEENGLSCVRCVTADDEWCAEEYMETDYTKLTDSDFEQSIRNFVAFHVANDNKF